jgi:hypothetical protein
VISASGSRRVIRCPSRARCHSLIAVRGAGAGSLSRFCFDCQDPFGSSEIARLNKVAVVCTSSVQSKANGGQRHTA